MDKIPNIFCLVRAAKEETDVDQIWERVVPGIVDESWLASLWSAMLATEDDEYARRLCKLGVFVLGALPDGTEETVIRELAAGRQ